MKLADQPEPPKCPYNNVVPGIRHPNGLNARACPTCRLHNGWVSARRRALLRTGNYVPRPHATHPVDPELRKPVPKCGLRHPSKEAKRTCPRCKARNRYTEALRRDGRRDGHALIGLVDSAEVVCHVNDVLVPSGLSLARIADHAGVDVEVVSHAVRGVHKKIHSINAAAILSVKPLPYPMYGKGDHINATGTRRILRGLYAQGWTAAYMGELIGLTQGNFWHFIVGQARGRERGFVKPEMAEAARRLRDKLGAYDVADLDEPMDGMSRRCANRAAKRGWVVLGDWDGLDIDDPRITPHGSDQNLEASNGLVLIDPDKVEQALRFRTAEDASGALSATKFPLPLTMTELYEVVRAGSARDRTGEPRFSANLLAQRLGASNRTIQRFRSEIRLADLTLDTAPPLAVAAHAAALIVATVEWPATTRISVALALLAPYPLRRSFYRHLTIWGATQPRPYGRGWSDEQLADWLGCSEKEAADLRSHAVLAGRQYHSFPAPGTTGRPPTLGAEYPPVAA